MSYRQGRCRTCGYLPLGESSYMQPYCTCPKRVRKPKEVKPLTASSKCPLCGNDYPHQHSPLEQIIYKNGLKAGRLSAAPTAPVTPQVREALEQDATICDEKYAYFNEQINEVK